MVRKFYFKNNRIVYGTKRIVIYIAIYLYMFFGMSTLHLKLCGIVYVYQLL